MQRRNVASSNSSDKIEGYPPSNPSTPGRTASASRTTFFGGRRRRQSSSPGVNPWIILLFAAVVTIVSYFFPSEVHQVEQEAEQLAKKAYEAEREIEREMAEWWQGEGQNKPPVIVEHTQSTSQVSASSGSTSGGSVEMNEATKRMLQQESKWVDGEKKLKAKLKGLVEQQARGQEVGVPVLTRYLGDDFPAWAPKDWTEEQVQKWNQDISDKYVEMRKAETEWQGYIMDMLEQQKQQG